MKNVPPEVLDKVMDQARRVTESFVEAIKAAIIAAGYDYVTFEVKSRNGGYHIAMDTSKVPPDELPRVQKICEAAALSFQYSEAGKTDDGDDWKADWTADRPNNFPDRPRTVH